MEETGRGNQQHQRLDVLEPQHGDGGAQVADLSLARVQSGIGNLEDLGCEPDVHLDDLLQLSERDLTRAPAQSQDLLRHLRHHRQISYVC